VRYRLPRAAFSLVVCARPLRRQASSRSRRCSAVSAGADCSSANVKRWPRRLRRRGGDAEVGFRARRWRRGTSADGWVEVAALARVWGGPAFGDVPPLRKPVAQTRTFSLTVGRVVSTFEAAGWSICCWAKPDRYDTLSSLNHSNLVSA
jgi:hypothetical protein